ncbi:alanine racemase [uncultured Mycolicibacterium sp.]|uniref:alanine racemase n=1 Tax=uncultured Mycolicibacterium sp. TaxID=2320817 RepID=UPI002619B2BD|nr:alanine racemase [uncultured Mycolicibacterium sp.]
MADPIDRARLAALADEPLDWRHRWLPAAWQGATGAEICARAPVLAESGVLGPVCVLSDTALRHNIATMARWCAERGVELAPHGKTHMSPQLLARQLAAGACGVTVAHVGQARVYRAFGVRSIILANELVDPAGLAWVAAELDADPNLELVCWVDSTAGVAAMDAALAAAGAARPLPVCVELGLPGGRTGCRTDGQVDAVTRAVLASPRLRLAGVAGYEAALGQDPGPAARAGVVDHLRRLRAAALRLAPAFETDTVLVSAGGSYYFDLVARELAGDWPTGLRVRTVLRSGCYLTHDHGGYAQGSPLRDRLRPALTVWARVLSRPEPGLALVGMGRRDVSFDQQLPVPLDLPQARVTRLDDQHAYLTLAGPDVPVGRWLAFGIAHPCTVFDKWPLLPVLDDAGRVVELVRTFF